MPYQYYPCNTIYYTGDHAADYSRALTAWNLNNQYTIPNNALLMPKDDPNGYDRATLYFTPTVPKCYASHPYPFDQPDGRDSCNIVFNAWPNGNNSGASLQYILNGSTVGGCHLSGVAQHGATQGFDLANTGTIYSDTLENTLIIQNISNSTIQVDHFKIYRIYKMCNPVVLNLGNCPYCENGTIHCSGGHPSGTHGSFDSTRVDIPCNCYPYPYGGSLSYSYYHDDNNAGSTLQKLGGTLSWTFNFSNYSDNYQGKSICIINFNNVWANSTDSVSTHDVELDLLLTVGGTEHTVMNYYLSRIEGEALAPSYDLAQSNYYNDTGANTVTLKNLGSVDVIVSPNPSGGIDVYRMYKSTHLCDSQCQSGQTECQSCECGCVTCQSACQVSCQSCYFCEFCAAPCYSCYIACQETCEVECQGCQTGCEVTCQTGCEVSCQTGCQVNCQTGCEVACQTGCELACQTCEGFCEPQCYACETCYTCVGTCQTCQTPCEWSCQNCQAGCEISCQESCQLSCQEACQVSCQTCYTTCQSGCEVSCQTCEGGCEPSCYACETCYTCIVSCQTGCEVSCQTGCQVTCQTGCQVSCQTGCEISCQTGCQVTCQNCQTGCEVGCQQGEGWCEPYCYACQSCMTCQGCQASCQACQTGCEVSCQETCQLSCQGCYGCYTCQACEAGCQQGEGGCEPYCYACQSCMTCESGQS